MSRRDKFYNQENFLFTEQFKKNKSINLFINKLFLFSNKVYEIKQEDFKNLKIIDAEKMFEKIKEENKKFDFFDALDIPDGTYIH